MTELVLLLLFFQTLGAFVGAITAVWGEFAYLRAMRDCRLDSAERIHLDIIARGLRYGMTLLLVSTLGLVIASYLLHIAVQPALTPVYWTLMFLSFLIVGLSWALSKKHVGFKLGSVSIFTAWWFLAYLATGVLSPLSFGSAVALFIVAVAVMYGLFYYLRLLSGHLAQKDN